MFPFLTTGATGQWFVAGLSTGGDRIRADLSFRITQFQKFGQWRLTTGTRLHQGRGAWARLTRAAVTHLLAPVGFTVQHPKQKRRKYRASGYDGKWLSETKYLVLTYGGHRQLHTDLLPTYFLTGKMSRAIKSFFICATQDVTTCDSTIANYRQSCKKYLLVIFSYNIPQRQLWDCMSHSVLLRGSIKVRLTLLNQERARLTGPAVAHLCAGVFSTVE